MVTHLVTAREREMEPGITASQHVAKVIQYKTILIHFSYHHAILLTSLLLLNYFNYLNLTKTKMHAMRKICDYLMHI